MGGGGGESQNVTLVGHYLLKNLKRGSHERSSKKGGHERPQKLPDTKRMARCMARYAPMTHVPL